jgi:ABC-2 type transport system permease protein
MDNLTVILVGIVLFFLTFVNAAGGYQNLIGFSIFYHVDGLLNGYSQIWYITIFICSIMAAFLGMMAINEDRFKGTFNVLLAKPVYRRDVIVGKFLGLTGFIVLFLTLEMVINFLVLYTYYGAPLSLSDVVVRILAYIFVLSLYLMLVIGLTMLIGTIVKSILTASALVVTYLSYEWFWSGAGTGTISTIIRFPLTPQIFTGDIIFGSDIDESLLFSSTPFTGWVLHALPGILVLMLIVVAVLLINCHVFAKTDDI